MSRFTILILAAGLLCAGCRSDIRRYPNGSREAQAARAARDPCERTCRVPIYETVMEPVYEKRTTPVFKEYEVPVYTYVEEPIYTTRYVPVQGYKTQPVMVRRKKPVKIDVQGRCGMEERPLYCVDQCIQTGVKRVPAQLGHHAVREQWGVKRGTGHRGLQARARAQRMQDRVRRSRPAPGSSHLRLEDGPRGGSPALELSSSAGPVDSRRRCSPSRRCSLSRR